METYKNYLVDLATLLKEEAFEAKNQKIAVGKEYEIGYLAALRDVLSLMQQQANSFNIPLSDINLSDLDPEKDLT